MAAQPRADWLERAGRLYICPLCLPAGQCESDYLDALWHRLAEATSDAGGEDLCAAQMTAFGLAPRDGSLADPIAVAAHLRRLDSLIAKLRDLDDDGWLTPQVCELCLERNEMVLLSARRLLQGLARQRNAAGRHLAEAGGLCASHFLMCWETASDSRDREVLARIQLAAVTQIAERARSGELDGPQARAWAMHATAITSL